MTMLTASLHRPKSAKVINKEEAGVCWVEIAAGGIDFCVYVRTPKKAAAIADAINMEDDT